jgi:hypothetical protein
MEFFCRPLDARTRVFRAPAVLRLSLLLLP